MFSCKKPKAQIVSDPSPIPVPTSPDTSELVLPRSRSAQSIATAMNFSPVRRLDASALRWHPGYWWSIQASLSAAN